MRNTTSGQPSYLSTTEETTMGRESVEELVVNVDLQLVPTVTLDIRIDTVMKAMLERGDQVIVHSPFFHPLRGTDQYGR